MMRNFIIALSIVSAGALGSVAIPVYAQSTMSLEARIQALLAQIQELTAQITRLREQQVEEIGSGDLNRHRICAVLARDLARGSRGEEVRAMQEYLSGEGLFPSSATGFFGPLTEQAVRLWQEREGLPNVGIFGPRSRARLMEWCKGIAEIPGQRFSASPRQGSAPLSVSFSSWISGFHSASERYVIDFGDGSSESATNCLAPADACTAPGINTHTYSKDGVYTATLSKIDDPCSGAAGCMAPISTTIIGKVQIRVGSFACTKEYKPVCGAKPIVCITTPCEPIPTTYGNVCTMKADGAELLSEGACRTGNPADDPQCKSWFDGCNSCARSTPGGPGMCTLKACINEALAKPYCTARFGDEQNAAPSISKFSGPTQLSVNEVGTWSIQASDKEGGALTYEIWWGDEHIYASSDASTVAARAISQTTSLTHTYSTAGSYTVTIVVRDNAGKSAKATTSVKVGSEPVACTMEYAPVCGQPPEPACRHSIPACMVATPGPQTYGNRCMMKAAGASFIAEGECKGNVSADMISWTTALNYINTCKVSSVTQAHSLTVNLTLKSGASYVTVEPSIDEVLRAIYASGCAGVSIATE